MYEEKNYNGVAVITIAERKDSKERSNIMKNKKKSFNLKRLKKEVQGITLIALVVTIIVLLILAGIALNLTVGQNGIFSRAQTATNTWRNTETNEQLAMGELEGWIDRYLNGNTGEIEEPEEGTLLKMFINAQEAGCDGTNCTNQENHLHIGDYVQLDNPVSGNAIAYSSETGYSSDQTYSINSEKNQLKWRVLGIDSVNGGIKLISETPLISDNEDGTLHLYGAQACVTGYLTPNTICEQLYSGLNSNYVKNVRSINFEDLKEILNITDEDITEMMGITQGTSEMYSLYGESYRLRGYTPESYLNGEKVDKDIVENGFLLVVIPESLKDSFDLTEIGYPVVNDRINNMLFGEWFNLNDFSFNPENAMTYYLPMIGNACEGDSISKASTWGVGCVGYGETTMISNVWNFYITEDMSSEVEIAFTDINDGAEVDKAEIHNFIRPVICLDRNVTNIQIPKL